MNNPYLSHSVQRSQLVAQGLVSLCLVTGLGGCQSKSSAPPPSAAEHATAALAQPAPVVVTVARVETRSVQRRISVIGTLRGFEHIVVTPKVEGRVLETKVDIGDRVPSGAVLMTLDPVDYQLAVNEASRALEHELSRLDLNSLPPEDFDIEQLPSVMRARLIVENALRQFDREKLLAEKNATTDQAVEQTETDHKVAEATLRQAQLDARSTLASVRHRQSVLSLAQQKLSETRVLSPAFTGSMLPNRQPEFVVANRMVSVGEMVREFPSTPVFELLVDDVLKLHVLVPERYMAQVVEGLKVEVRVEAYPDEAFLGKVTRINPTVDPENRSFDVEVHVPNADHRLKHGGFAKAEVIVGESNQALTIPIEALTRFAGVTKVFRVSSDVVQEVEIEMGAHGPGWIEALKGLTEGDLVVTSGQSRLANGTRITVRNKESRIAQQP